MQSCAEKLEDCNYLSFTKLSLIAGWFSNFTIPSIFIRWHSRKHFPFLLSFIYNSMDSSILTSSNRLKKSITVITLMLTQCVPVLISWSHFQPTPMSFHLFSSFWAYSYRPHKVFLTLTFLALCLESASLQGIQVTFNGEKVFRNNHLGKRYSLCWRLF